MRKKQCVPPEMLHTESQSRHSRARQHDVRLPLPLPVLSRSTQCVSRESVLVCSVRTSNECMLPCCRCCCGFRVWNYRVHTFCLKLHAVNTKPHWTRWWWWRCTARCVCSLENEHKERERERESTFDHLRSCRLDIKNGDSMDCASFF